MSVAWQKIFLKDDVVVPEVKDEGYLVAEHHLFSLNLTFPRQRIIVVNDLLERAVFERR